MKGAVVASLIAVIKDELAAVAIAQPSARAAQVGAVLRFAGELRVAPGHSVVNVEVDRRAVAHRLRDDINALYGYQPQVIEHVADSDTQPGRYSVRASTGAVALARQSGLIDRHGRPVRGLPARIVGGSVADAEAVWRGAFMVSGSVSDPRRATATVSCPTLESALALAGAARRLDTLAKARDGHKGHQVVVRDGDTVSELLHRLGANAGHAMFDEQRRSVVRRSGAQLENFDTANQQRTQISAAITAARVTRAFEILGESTPAHLAQFGRLRLDHPDATLDDLGRLADPPVTKDTAAGRLRRLLAAADTRAGIEGIPDTDASVPAELRCQL